MPLQHAVAGIDVGGDKKGCHLVILRGTDILCNLNAKIADASPEAMLAACIAFDVKAVGIDAPCRWRNGEAGRQAEMELARKRIFSFATPTRARAEANASGFYKWMFNGERVYQTLLSRYALFDNSATHHERVCFETFPHAITCALIQDDVPKAKLKRTQRARILGEHGVNTAALKSIDELDAALCALTAHALLAGKTRAYGDALGGYIVVPDLAPMHETNPE